MAWGATVSPVLSLSLVLLVLFSVIVLGVLELWLHRQRLKQIPIRIHINGTRGKSSVTRLITAALSHAGKVSCGKTTGTLPRMILPDGRELPIYRPSRANVIEQIRIVHHAADLKAEALAIECMALQPPYQWLCEDKLVRATIGVITNARPDHLDVMGPDDQGVAWALAGMIPPRAVLVTAERKPELVAIFESACRDRGTRLVTVNKEDVDAVQTEELGRFAYSEHAENVALVIKVCAELGIDRGQALDGMIQACPDPGAMTAHHIEFFGRDILFINGFAANDPVSTEMIWNRAIEEHPDYAHRIVVINCRSDRPERSLQLGRAVVGWTRPDQVVLVGDGTFIFARAAVVAGLDSSTLVFAESLRVEEVFEVILSKVRGRSLVMGMGNIYGPGLDLVRYFSNRATMPPANEGRSVVEKESSC